MKRPFLSICFLVTALIACGKTDPPPVVAAKPVVNDYPVKIPDTTKISDQSTRDSLTTFDATSGTMKFSQATAILENLKTDDVLVSEPTAAAPYGYLRKVKTMRKEGTGMVLETEPAKLTDAIQSGSLNFEAVKPDLPVSGQSTPLKPKLGGGGGINKGFLYDQNVSETICLNDNNCDAGNIKLDGRIRASVGLTLGLGVDYKFPASFVAYLEASAGGDTFADLNVAAHFNDNFKKEKLVKNFFEIVTVYIGPLPVVMFVSTDLFVGVDGNAQGDFTTGVRPTLTGRIGARWTSSNGFETFSPEAALNFRPPVLKASANVKAYIRTVSSIKLYGVFGPVIDSNAGAGIEAGFPRDPLWTVFGNAYSRMDLKGTFPYIDEPFDFSRVLLDKRFELGKAEIQPPTIAVNKPSTLAVFKKPIDLRQFYSTSDPQGRTVAVTASSSRDGTISTNPSLSGTPGPRTVTFTASNGDKTAQASLEVDAVNSPPQIVGAGTSASIPLGLPTYLSAFASDINEPQDRLGCEKLRWATTGTDVLTTETGSSFGCEPRIVFADQGARTFTATSADPEGLTTSNTINVNVTVRLAKNPPDVGRIEVRYRDTKISPGDLVLNQDGLTITAPVDNPDNSPATFEWSVEQIIGPNDCSSTPTEPCGVLFFPRRIYEFNQDQASINWGASGNIPNFEFPTKREKVCEVPFGGTVLECAFQNVQKPATVTITLSVNSPVANIQQVRTFTLQISPTIRIR